MSPQIGRSPLREGFRAARERTDSLFDRVRSEALLDRPIPERHRFLFYLGHLEAFDWNLLGREPRTGLERLFAFGIDPIDGSLPQDRPSDWPAPEATRAWALRTRADVDRLLDDPGVDPVRLHAALEHRLMHAETLAYMLRQVPLERLSPPPPGPSAPAATRRVEGLAGIPAGSAWLGMHPSERGAFGWDNERPGLAVEVPPFRIDRADVTWEDYLRFVEEGGYENRSLWPEAAWRWKQAQELRHPRSWRGAPGCWRLRATFEEIPLPLDWPAQVSHAEASAYAGWRGARLPTEAQHHRAAYGWPGERPGDPPRAYPWGDEPPEAHRGNFDFHRWDPVPVGSFPAGDSPFGVTDLLGNGWEWTRTPFHPFPGFEPLPFYPGYSVPFFTGDGPVAHHVLKGGGTRTAARLLRRSFRNWFQPHYPYVEASFRCVEE